MFTQNIGPICCGQCYSFQFYHPVFYNEKVIILSEGSGGGSFASHDCSLSCLLLPPIGGVGKSHPSTASPLPPFSCLEHHSVTSPSPENFLIFRPEQGEDIFCRHQWYFSKTISKLLNFPASFLSFLSEMGKDLFIQQISKFP